MRSGRQLLLMTVALSAAGCQQVSGASSQVPAERRVAERESSGEAQPVADGAARPVRYGTVPPLPPDCPHVTEREVFLAEYSINYAVTSAVRGVAAHDWQPVSLSQAVQWLRCDPDDARRAGRIRFAAVKLAAGIAVLSPPPGAKPSAMVGIMVQTLADLLGQVASRKLVDALLKTGAGTFAEFQDRAGAAIDAEKDDKSLTSLQRMCCPCITDCRAGPSVDGSLVEFTVKVNRSTPCIFHVIDPQCWPAVAPGYFNSVFVLQDAPSCTAGVPTCRSNTTCDSTLPSPVQSMTPPTAGLPWCGLFFEDVTASSNDVTAEFKDVLKATTSFVPTTAMNASAATGFRMDYGLCESMSYLMCDPGGSVCTDSQCGCGSCPIDRDCGFAELGGTGGPTGTSEMDGSKHIHFGSGLPHDGNEWAPLALEVLVQETANSMCVPASNCASAAAPSACIELPGPDKCVCGPDHCDQLSSVTAHKAAPFCSP